MSKNPDMKKETAYAIATQQAHKLGKTPKGYGTSEGKAEARRKYSKPRKSYKKTAMIAACIPGLAICNAVEGKRTS